MKTTQHTPEVGVNNPEWHDNTPTPFEIAYFALHHGVAKNIITDGECESSKAAIKALLAQRDELLEACKALLEHHGSIDAPRTYRARAQAKAAIAKAQGNE